MTTERPVLMPCEHCQSEGRILTANGNDPDDIDHGECPVCEGTGGALIESEPVDEIAFAEHCEELRRDEVRRLENEEMEKHFRDHPHG